MRPAGHQYTREQLAALKRADLQKLCKDYGVRANMKTDALIEFLLESINSNMAPLIQQHAPVPRRASTRSSSRVSSLRSRGVSGSSTSTNIVTTGSHPTTTSSPRNNKAKATQYRLGVGRPSTVGSLGARNSTRSSSLARSARGKNSRSLRPQETIDEEPASFEQTTQPEPGPSRPKDSRDPCDHDSSDIQTRLSQLETLVRDSDAKRHIESFKDLPSQVAWLKSSIQQREAEIIGLRGELNVCKAECLELRGAVSKIPQLESQLKAMKDSVDHLLSVVSVNGKDKVHRRVSIPLGDSNTNTVLAGKPASGSTLPPPVNSLISQNQNNIRANVPGPSTTALGKRPRDADVHDLVIPDARERNGMTEEEYARRNGRYERKRPKGDRLPLQEKILPPRREIEKAVSDHDSGEEYAPSAGTSTSVPTNPSVKTPPTAIPQFFDDLVIHSDGSQTDQPPVMDFYNAASSTPRVEIFNFLDESTEPFTPGSALKAHEAPQAQTAQLTKPRSHDADAQRRISTNIPRPRTPTRVTGPQRFRNAVYESESPVQEPMQSPYNPFDSVYTIPFGPSVREAREQERRAEPPEPVVQTSIPIALGIGLATSMEETPHREVIRTLYGTEMNSTGRFGDFGRLGPLPHNFWTGY